MKAVLTFFAVVVLVLNDALAARKREIKVGMKVLLFNFLHEHIFKKFKIY